MKYFLTILFSLLCINTYAQDSTLLKRKTDSLKIAKLQYSADTAFQNPIHALTYMDSSLKLAQTMPAKKFYANALVNAGYIYMSIGNHKKALEYFFEALPIYEKLNKQKGIANCYGNIAAIYDNEKDYKQGLEYFMKAIKIFELIKDSSAIAITYSNIGTIYANKYEQNKDKSSLEMSLYCHLNALRIASKLNDTLFMNNA